MNLTESDSHFSFGQNWASYARSITEQEIDEAVAGIERLFGGSDAVAGSSFLDIGSGSGLHSLAALRLGVRKVLAVDIDADSVETTRAVLERFAPNKDWRAERISVFDLPRLESGAYDLVYAWGVLHHTGDLFRAIQSAAQMVAADGKFAVALYRRIWTDPFWRHEKRWYAHASPKWQARARALYKALFRFGLLTTGRSPSSYIHAYGKRRGMDFDHDVHDWLGGWPYESISPKDVDKFMNALGFTRFLSSIAETNIFRDFFGSGCDEFVYKKTESE